MKKAIFSTACILGLGACPGVARAQEGVDEGPTAGEPGDASGASDPAPGTDPVAPAEEVPSEEVPSSDGSLDETDEASSATPSDEGAASEEEAAPPEDAALPEDAAGEGAAGDAAGEPDYFGGLEPSAPLYQLEDPSVPEKPRYMGPFRAGAVRFGLGIGGGGYGDQTYFLLGFGVGYFLVNGLELHVDTDFWLIGEPFMATPSPGLRYVMWFVPKVHPYVGGFYRHYFTGSGYPDANSIGARAGVYLMTGRSSYFGIGAAYEHMLDEELFVGTDFISPEIAFAFAF